MKTVLVVYHSQSGVTERMAQAVRDGATEIEGCVVTCKRACAADLEDMVQADAIIIGSPEYFGYMAGAVKDFFDRTYDHGHRDPRIVRKPYAVFIAAGNDGSGALSSIERICRGYRLKKVCEPVVATGMLTEEQLARCRELGQTIAAGCVQEIY
ncbi:MAG: NAD(P)H-dependent oxidoreductase [Desulfobacterota bacterium]|nr:NAD(P)H-dependent oxidoreductase [Thermodesulfobacteriota bacterium]